MVVLHVCSQIYANIFIQYGVISLVIQTSQETSLDKGTLYMTIPLQCIE